jgi:hypothetical protein
MLVTGAAVAAAAVGGGAIANAATSSSSSTASTAGQAPPAFSGPAHGTAAHEDAEKPVTGAAAAKAQASAVKLVGGGTRRSRHDRSARRRLRDDRDEVRWHHGRGPPGQFVQRDPGARRRPRIRRLTME